MKTEDETKLESMGFKIVSGPEWLWEQKIGGKNENIIKEKAAIKIQQETEKVYKVIGTRIPKPELTDEQKVVLLKLYLTGVPEWIPKSQIKME